MSLKIYGAVLNAVRVSGQSLLTGPGFFINSDRDFTGFYPAFADASSNDVFKVDPNFGQRAFKGDPSGFTPYDPAYDGTNVVGGYSKVGNVFVPYNNTAIVYNKTYATGKYYYEVDIVDAGDWSAVGFASGARRHNVLTGDTGVGMKRIGRDYVTAGGHDDGAGGEDWAYYRVNDGDTLQVWVDFDNMLLSVIKLGTDVNDHVNPIIQ